MPDNVSRVQSRVIYTLTHKEGKCFAPGCGRKTHCQVFAGGVLIGRLCDDHRLDPQQIEAMIARTSRDHK